MTGKTIPKYVSSDEEEDSLEITSNIRAEDTPVVTVGGEGRKKDNRANPRSEKQIAVFETARKRRAEMIEKRKDEKIKDKVVKKEEKMKLKTALIQAVNNPPPTPAPPIEEEEESDEEVVIIKKKKKRIQQKKRPRVIYVEESDDESDDEPTPPTPTKIPKSKYKPPSEKPPITGQNHRVYFV